MDVILFLCTLNIDIKVEQSCFTDHLTSNLETLKVLLLSSLYPLIEFHCLNCCPLSSLSTMEMHYF